MRFFCKTWKKSTAIDAKKKQIQKNAGDIIRCKLLVDTNTSDASGRMFGNKNLRDIPVKNAQTSPCIAFAMKYFLNEIPLPEQIVIIWQCTDNPDHAINAEHKISAASIFFIDVVALTPLVISKKPNKNVPNISGSAMLQKKLFMHPTSAEKKTM